MFTVLSDEIRKLINDVTPWIVGSEGADKDFAPVFKKNTPTEVIEKHKQLIILCKN